ncbi:hypothetical protein [Bradyrhizobium sp. BRP22]|uniref:hypothetical protein n=1 Tax=Bradyrhizobium sp. BRP22 TaxID=2793821 RepID=UPI001CD5C142|nr:hypothetical protein [Bradyrhizobium sp. BRP22]
MSIVIQKNAPAHNAEYRDQIRQSLSSPQLRVLCPTAGFEYLVEDLDLPSQGIPFELLDRIAARLHRKIGPQLRIPIDVAQDSEMISPTIPG